MTTNLKPAWLLKHFLLPACLVLSALMAQAEPAPATSPLDADGNFSGKVVQTMTTAGYTYILVDTGRQKVWAATTESTFTNGDNVTVFGGIQLVNFHSKSLNRDFDSIYFTGKIAIRSDGANGVETAPVLPPGHPALPGQSSLALPPNHPPLTDQPAPAAVVNLAGIKKAEGGKTVQEIIFGGGELAGQPVKVRGKVVKYNARVMGKNWLHIQDGSGTAEKKDNDLTITTAMPARLGDTVLVTGKVSINRDFGAGYKYDVILEDAIVTVE